MSEKPTRERLLNAAEALIAARGYHTPLREITDQARANVASINYYFGSKEGLAEAVIQRRLIAIDRVRLQRLDAVCQTAREAGHRPDVEGLLRALIEPVLHTILTGEGGRHFLLIVSRMHTDPDGVLKRLFLKTVQPAFVRFFSAFRDALPDLPPQIILARMSFAIGAMSHAAMIMTDPAVLDFLPPDMGFDMDFERHVDELIHFLTRGMTAPQTHDPETP